MMKRTVALIAAATGLFLLAAGATFAAAPTVVTVTLWDKGPYSATPDDAPPMGYGPNGDMKMAMLGVKADVYTEPAGTVTFQVTNASKDIVHKMILMPMSADSNPLPYVKNELRVDEDVAGHLGEVSELDPGKSGALTVDLTPGKYILFCTIPAHFMNGMRTVITVK